MLTARLCCRVVQLFKNCTHQVFFLFLYFLKPRPLCISSLHPRCQLPNPVELLFHHLVFFSWILSVAILPHLQSETGDGRSEGRDPPTSDRWGGGGLAWPGARLFSPPDPTAVLVAAADSTFTTVESKTKYFWLKISKICIIVKAWDYLLFSVLC